MTNNKLHVVYSARYANYVIMDDHGQLQFSNDGRPLIFTTRLDAAAAIR